ncbi:MAG: DUF6125 family protein [Actinomycetota bacterium]
MKLSEKDKISYYYNSYVKVDGLWFIKVEENLGFEQALEIDRQVWEVLPKIQARFFKSKLKDKQGLEALSQCIEAKLKLDNFYFKTNRTQNMLQVEIHRCPWHNMMVKSGREKLSSQVGSLVCDTEYSVWASEFGDNLDFKLSKRICGGHNRCILSFLKAE